MKSIKFGELLHIYKDKCQDKQEIKKGLLEPLADWNIHYEKTVDRENEGIYYNVILEPPEA